MMRPVALIFVAGALMLLVPLGFGADEAGTKPTTKPKQPTESKVEAASPKKTDNAEVVAARKNGAEEAAIRKAGDSYVEAFNKEDAKSVAEHYTEDAEYIDEHGRTFLGRKAIEGSLKEFFTSNPDSKLALKIDSIRVVGPGVAIEDGVSTVTRSNEADPYLSRYTVFHVKHTGKWLVASVREFAPPKRRMHRVQLKQLDWMLGDWVHEGNDAVVEFSCKAVDNGNFLLRSFTIRIAGQDAMSGSQRIGWDAQAGKFHSWIFDSDGGHSDGFWHRDGDTWVLKAHGVTADGESASSTSIYAHVDRHTMTFQSVDHEVAGVEFPDSAKVKIVRRPPQPE